MEQKPSSRRRRSSAKSILRLPDLEHAKAAVLNSLTCPDAQRGYGHAIDEFVDGLFGTALGLRQDGRPALPLSSRIPATRRPALSTYVLAPYASSLRGIRLLSSQRRSVFAVVV